MNNYSKLIKNDINCTLFKLNSIKAILLNINIHQFTAYMLSILL